MTVKEPDTSCEGNGSSAGNGVCPQCFIPWWHKSIDRVRLVQILKLRRTESFITRGITCNTTLDKV